jgi:hypothetical protein
MSVETCISTGDSEIRARVELTETHLITRYYAVRENELPANWNKLSQDEQAVFISMRCQLLRNDVEEIQERTDGVYLTWEKSHPQWTVTFTYTNTEVVAAPTREVAIKVARDAIVRTYQKECRPGALNMLVDARAEVVNGNYGL